MDSREGVIVCGVDGSPAGQRALRWALDEAQRRGCRLRALTAWSWDGLEAVAAASGPADARGHAERAQAKALAEAMGGMTNPPQVEKQLVQASPSEALCTAGLDADLLVIGSHGHSPIHDVLVGSTSQRIIRHATCPVVVLPDPRHVEKERKHVERRHRFAEPPGAVPMF